LGYFLLPPLHQISLGLTDHTQRPLLLHPSCKPKKKTQAASASSQALPSLFILYHLAYIRASKGANGLYKNITRSLSANYIELLAGLIGPNLVRTEFIKRLHSKYNVEI
jgi:hypothetical protein